MSRAVVSVLVALGAATALGATGPHPADVAGDEGSGGPVPAAAATEVAALFCSAGAEPIPRVDAGDVPRGRWERTASDAPGPPFYAVDLVSTKKLPGSARATGTGHVTFEPSPFGVALGPDGSYVYDVSIQLQGLEAPSNGVLVAWLTTTQVD
ncbi:MAG: hypothetical protein PVJ02_18505, partial [Gemmatimonadota bacterium]